MAKGKKQVKEVNPLYKTTREVVAFLGLSAGTLCVWRSQGKGSSYYKVGNAVRYKIDDVEAWKNENVKRVELTN